MAIHVHLASLLLLAAVPIFAQTNPAPAPSATAAHAPTTDSTAVPKQPTPTVFQADKGDRWMLLGDKPLIFKVDPVGTGSDALVVQTEEMPPGNKIPTHKHLHEDEVIFVYKGTVRVLWLDVNTTQERERQFSSRRETGSAWRTFPASLP